MHLPGFARGEFLHLFWGFLRYLPPKVFTTIRMANLIIYIPMNSSIRKIAMMISLEMILESFALAGPLANKTAIFEINGIKFSCRLPSNSRGLSLDKSNPTVLRPGEFKIPMMLLPDAEILGGLGKTQIGTCIKFLEVKNLRTAKLKTQTFPGGEAQFMFAPRDKPSSVEYRTINGRDWLVTTKFEDEQRQVIRSRVYWIVEQGFLITFNLIIDSDAPKDTKWRSRRLSLLDALVADFNVIIE